MTQTQRHQITLDTHRGARAGLTRTSRVTLATGPVTITSRPQVVHLRIYQGDDLYLYLEVYDADGDPADLTGLTPLSHIRRGPADTAPDLMAEIDITQTAANELELHLTHPQAEQLTRNGVWDAQLTDAQGRVVTLCYGTVTPTLEVTR